MATEIWVDIGSGNGLLPDSTKPLPEPSVKSSDNFTGDVSTINHNNLFENYMSKISKFPGANELSYNIIKTCHWKHIKL